MEESPLLVVENISKTYQISQDGKPSTFHALENVSFELKRNQSIGLIGKNGSGKSTLLKIIAGLVKPSSGKVEIYGKINPLIEVGSNFFPDLTGRENVKEFFKINNIAAETHVQKTESVLEFSELGHYFDQPIKQYSAGMFVRLAISAGFHIDADIFLIDEVLMAGDASFREKVSAHFKTILSQGAAVILASHSPEEIIENCSECFWLESGSIKTRKLAKEVLDDYYIQYANEYASKRQDVLSHIKNQDKEGNLNLSDFDQNMFENEILKVLDYKLISNKISKDSKVELVIKIEKKVDDISLHPFLKIYNVFSKPIMGVISSNDNEIYTELESLRSAKGNITFKCFIDTDLFSSGVYYIDFMLVKDPVYGLGYVEEIFKIPYKLNFEIDKGKTSDFASNSLEVFIQPRSEWNIEF